MAVPRNQRKTKFIGLDLPEDDYEFLRAYARRDGNRPMTSVLRAVFQDWIFHQRLTEQNRAANQPRTPAIMNIPAARVQMSSRTPLNPEAREIPDTEAKEDRG